ncbi:unnamed protein product [Paramecium primaurelia]|uniref:Uncharacterized protein n=1 Tax=Paramecium primaurelia TaxID=5886 RepID=A0A8S1Q7E4_PARPR|nr:unnamed protein product [Paramecium primaurelia]CAD8111187.1 unnamed protein product [Paramecium primaurelia]
MAIMKSTMEQTKIKIYLKFSQGFLEGNNKRGNQRFQWLNLHFEINNHEEERKIKFQTQKLGFQLGNTRNYNIYLIQYTWIGTNMFGRNIYNLITIGFSTCRLTCFYTVYQLQAD